MKQRLTRIQTLVNYAISNDQMFPSSNLLKEIALSSSNKLDTKQILELCYNQLEELTKPQKIWKSIKLLRYLLECGSDRIFKTIVDQIFKIEFTLTYDGVPEAIFNNIRYEATKLCELVDDMENIQRIRSSFKNKELHGFDGDFETIDPDSSFVRDLQEKELLGADFEDPSKQNDEDLTVAVELSKRQKELEDVLISQQEVEFQKAINMSQMSAEELEMFHLKDQQDIERALTISLMDENERRNLLADEERLRLKRALKLSLMDENQRCKLLAEEEQLRGALALNNSLLNENGSQAPKISARSKSLKGKCVQERIPVNKDNALENKIIADHQSNSFEVQCRVSRRREVDVNESDTVKDGSQVKRMKVHQKNENVPTSGAEQAILPLDPNHKLNTKGSNHPLSSTGPNIVVGVDADDKIRISSSKDSSSTKAKNRSSSSKESVSSTDKIISSSKESVTGYGKIGISKPNDSDSGKDKNRISSSKDSGSTETKVRSSSSKGSISRADKISSCSKDSVTGEDKIHRSRGKDSDSGKDNICISNSKDSGSGETKVGSSRSKESVSRADKISSSSKDSVTGEDKIGSSKTNDSDSGKDKIRISSSKGSVSRTDKISSSSKDSVTGEDKIGCSKTNDSDSGKDKIRISSSKGSVSRTDKISSSSKDSVTGEDKIGSSKTNDSDSGKDKIRISSSKGSVSRTDTISSSSKDSGTGEDEIRSSRGKDSDSVIDKICISNSKDSGSGETKVRSSRSKESVSRADMISSSSKDSVTGEDKIGSSKTNDSDSGKDNIRISSSKGSVSRADKISSSSKDSGTGEDKIRSSRGKDSDSVIDKICISNSKDSGPGEGKVRSSSSNVPVSRADKISSGSKDSLTGEDKSRSSRSKDSHSAKDKIRISSSKDSGSREDRVPRSSSNVMVSGERKIKGCPSGGSLSGKVEVPGEDFVGSSTNNKLVSEEENSRSSRSKDSVPHDGKKLDSGDDEVNNSRRKESVSNMQGSKNVVLVSGANNEKYDKESKWSDNVKLEANTSGVSGVEEELAAFVVSNDFLKGNQPSGSKVDLTITDKELLIRADKERLFQEALLVERQYQQQLVKQKKIDDDMETERIRVEQDIIAKKNHETRLIIEIARKKKMEAKRAYQAKNIALLKDLNGMIKLLSSKHQTLVSLQHNPDLVSLKQYIGNARDIYDLSVQIVDGWKPIAKKCTDKVLAKNVIEALVKVEVLGRQLRAIINQQEILNDGDFSGSVISCAFNVVESAIQTLKDCEAAKIRFRQDIDDVLLAPN